MEIGNLFKNGEIIGIVSNYESNFNFQGKVKDLNVKNIEKGLKMVLLDETILYKEMKDLTLSELFKIELLTKLNNDVIVVGNLSKVLNYKDLEYIKKLLLKLNNDYNKKIVVIDRDVKVFFNLVKWIYVIKNKEIIYTTNDFFDQKLYEYTKCPKIIEFINYALENNIKLTKTLDIYELIKDIYRIVS